MAEKTKVAALGAEGWFTQDGDPALIGSRCTTCGTFSFPKRSDWCPNPTCRGTEQVDHLFSRTGKIWSYTDAQYQPPAPYVCPTNEFAPFAIAAIALEAEGIVVVGQLTQGVGVDDVSVGDEVELVVQTLFSDDDHDYQIWRWKPLENS